MRLRIGAPRHALIVAPHPDDEAIGCFGLIRRLRRDGTKVRVLIVTDGAASHPGSVTWPRARLVRERKRETRRALRRLGIPASAIDTLGLPDAGLEGSPAAAARLRRAIARRWRPGLLVGPLADDDHGDHRATAAALAATRLRGVRRLGYPVWPLGRRPAHARAVPFGTGICAAKRSTLRGYRTQTGAIRDDPTGFAMSRRELETFGRACEWFVEVRPCVRSR